MVDPDAGSGAPQPGAGAWHTPGARQTSPAALLAIVLVIATAGLVYELVMAAVASYVLGDSVTQFSLVIGVYLSALGLGAYLSRFVTRQLEVVFIDVELAAALIGGLSAPALFVAFSFTSAFQLILYSTVLAVGALVGLELPLLIRILQHQIELKDLIARALTFDYIGALLGSLAFSFVFVPELGLVQTSVVCGLLNALVGLASTWLLRPAALRQSGARAARDLSRARIRAMGVVLLLLIALLEAERVTELSEAALFGGRIVVAEQSRYQRIVLVERERDHALYLNGNLQFSSRDEHRYHEALVHPAMSAAARRTRVLVGGGGDGLAVREILRWPEVASVTVVDLDERMTQLARTHPALERLNQGALSDPSVRLVHADAMVWLGATQERFDVIVLDFPDPSNYSLGKLYSERFYRRAREQLSPGGALVVQSTSPLFARKAFWCVVATLRAAGLETLAYHVFLPSFGEWGFVLAKSVPFARPHALPATPLRYLTSETLAALFDLPPDIGPVATRVNRLNNQALVGYYIEEWERFQ